MSSSAKNRRDTPDIWTIDGSVRINTASGGKITPNSGTQASHLADGATNAPTNAATNNATNNTTNTVFGGSYSHTEIEAVTNALATAVNALATNVNGTATKLNTTATNLNDLATKVNSILDALEGVGILAAS